MNIYSLKKKKTSGIVVNRALPSLHGGSLEITLNVPLNKVSVSFTMLFISVKQNCILII